MNLTYYSLNNIRIYQKPAILQNNSHFLYCENSDIRLISKISIHNFQNNITNEVKYSNLIYWN